MFVKELGRWKIKEAKCLHYLQYKSSDTNINYLYNSSKHIFYAQDVYIYIYIHLLSFENYNVFLWNTKFAVSITVN